MYSCSQSCLSAIASDLLANVLLKRGEKCVVWHVLVGVRSVIIYRVDILAGCASLLTMVSKPYIINALSGRYLATKPYTSECMVDGVSRLAQWFSFHVSVHCMPHTEHPLSTTRDELNKRMDVMVDLCKATNHPLLLRHHYTDHTLHCMVRAILKEPSHRDAAPNLVWDPEDIYECNVRL